MTEPRYRHIDASVHDGILVITVLERCLIGLKETDGYRQEVRQAFAQAGTTKVVVDFEHVDIMGADATGPLVALHRKLRQVAGRLVVCGLQDQIKVVFDVSGLSQVFAIQPDIPTAIISLQGWKVNGPIAALRMSSR
jgi:anti-anti-sigma factor